MFAWYKLLSSQNPPLYLINFACKRQFAFYQPVFIPDLLRFVVCVSETIPNITVMVAGSTDWRSKSKGPPRTEVYNKTRDSRKQKPMKKTIKTKAAVADMKLANYTI